MEIKIGITYSPKEIGLELADDVDLASMRSEFEGLLGSDAAVWWVTDKKGRQVGVPVEKVAYVEFGAPDQTTRIGFGG